MSVKMLRYIKIYKKHMTAICCICFKAEKKIHIFAVCIQNTKRSLTQSQAIFSLSFSLSSPIHQTNNPEQPAVFVCCSRFFLLFFSLSIGKHSIAVCMILIHRFRCCRCFVAECKDFFSFFLLTFFLYENYCI